MQSVKGDAGKEMAAAALSAWAAHLRSSHGVAGTVDSILQRLGSNSSSGTESWGHLEEMRQNTSDFRSRAQQTVPDSAVVELETCAECSGKSYV